MRSTAKRIDPGDYILAVLSPEDRLDAALKVTGEAFKTTRLRIEDVEKAVKSVRRRANAQKNKVVIDTGVLVSAFAFVGLPRKAVTKAFLFWNH